MSESPWGFSGCTTFNAMLEFFLLCWPVYLRLINLKPSDTLTFAAKVGFIAGSSVAGDFAGIKYHKPGGDIDTVANNGVLVSSRMADHSAKHHPGGNADREQAQPEFLHANQR